MRDRHEERVERIIGEVCEWTVIMMLMAFAAFVLWAACEKANARPTIVEGHCR